MNMLLEDMPVNIQDGIVYERIGHYYSWATFLDPSVPVNSKVRAAVISRFLQHESIQAAASKPDEALAYAKDRYGREIWYATDSQTREFFKDVLFFCARYEIFDGPAIHVSATSVVVYAYDHGICEQAFDEQALNGILIPEQFIACNRTLGRQNVERNAKDSKYLRDTEKWSEEFKLWDKDKNGEMTKSEFLAYCQQSFGGGTKSRVEETVSVKLMPSPPLATLHESAQTLTLHGDIQMKDYPNVLVMAAADRSLEDIFLKERPTDNLIRGMLEEVATHLAEIHNRGLVHGDVKKLNVLRVHNHDLKFIDFDAATPIGQPLGSKFSSGICLQLETKEDMASHKAYWQGQIQDLQQWKKLKPREKYVVRSFRRENSGVLPYSLVNATPAIDMWSFGCMVYQMLSGVELLPTDVNQDVVTDRIKKAATWTNEKLKARVEANISDEQGQDLVLQLLVRDPEKRMSAKDALNHPYFTSRVDNTDILEALESMEKSTKCMEETIEAISTETELGRKITLEATEKSKSALQQATAVVSSAHFEASEVAVPFVVLPYKISSENKANNEKAKELVGFMGRFQNTCQKVIKALMEGDSVGEILTTFMHGEPLYLYLIDEANGRVVVPKEKDEVYPIEIPTDNTTFFSTCLPWIQRGFQILKFTNAIGDKIGIKPWDAWLESVGLKLTDDDDKGDKGDKDSDDEKDPLEEAIDSVLEMEPTITFDVIARGLKNRQVPVKQVRGVALRELNKFLDDKDPEHTFAGLERMLTDEGRIQWTTKQELPEDDDQILQDIREVFSASSKIP
ncbi:hypothetical protein AC1031_011431 [Aphanomyces cochlioides]|nr:hypothetical protein AC1031_011431 [Aphanomyces cochlioides]